MYLPISFVQPLTRLTLEDEFVEEIIEDEEDMKSNNESDDVFDEVGDVEMPMGETGQRFHETALSDDDYESVVIEKVQKNNKPSKYIKIASNIAHENNQHQLSSKVLKSSNNEIESKANLFNQRMSNKYSNSYEYKSKTINSRVKQSIKDTIDEDEIKEEINVIDDDSDDENLNEKLRKRFMDKMTNQISAGRQSKTSSNQKREIIHKIAHEVENPKATPDLHIKQKGLNMIELEVDAIDDDSEEDKRNVSLK